MGGKAVKPRFFSSPELFRRWLERHHESATELLVGFHKRGSGRASMTWPESVDEALSYGWIDGVRKRIDDTSYTIRFTPRRSSSIWSAVNIRRVGELSKAGRMMPAGLAVLAHRRASKSAIYAYEQDGSAEFPAPQLALLRKNRAAWRYFQAQAPWYKRRAIHRIVSAKQEATRIRRLESMIALWALRQRED